MSIPGSALPLLLASPAGAAGYEIERSLRFNSADSAYLSRTCTATGNRRKFTWSYWLKRSGSATTQTIWSTSGSTPWGGFYQNGFWWNFSSSDIWINDYGNPALRDFSAWYHFVLAVDTEQATSTDRVKVYINGVQYTVAGAIPAQNSNITINESGDVFNIGGLYYFSGYLADFHYVDGQQLAESDFGEFDDNGVWQPIEYAGTYGTNGFHLPFSDNSSASALGTDDSGNGNDWTVNNISAGIGNGRYISTLSTDNGSFTSTQEPYYGFDGSTSTFCSCATSGASGYLDIDVSAWNLTGSVEIYSFSGNYYSVDGGTATAFTNGWNNVGNAESITTVRLTRSLGTAGFTAIRVNGVVLVDYAADSGNDSLFDSPTNGDTANDTGAGGEVPGNYATWNVLDKGAGLTLANGNLQIVSVTNDFVRSTIGVSSGKWYAEYTQGTGLGMVGIADGNADNTLYLGQNTGGDGYGYYSGGTTYTDGAGGVSYGASYTTGDVIGVAFDADNGTLVFYKNGTSQGTAFTGLTSGPYFFAAGVDTMANSHMNFGQRPFAYSAPSGFRPLATPFLDTPTIEDGSTAMDVVLWTGDDATPRAISGLGFSPDFVWIKQRNNSRNHGLFDVVRGANEALFSNLTDTETTYTNTLMSFDSDGFSVGGNALTNVATATYVGWTWDAGASTVANTDGSISSSVRANPTAGFSIVSYTGAKTTTTADTVGHGLNIEPAMLIVKDRDTTRGWLVYHKYNTYQNQNPNTNSLELNLTNISYYGNSYPWGSTTPTSSVFTINNLGSDSYYNLNQSGKNYIAYCFAPVEGYSAFGSYTGTQPFIYTGFRPRWIMVRRYDVASSQWVIFDSARSGYNGDNDTLCANQNNSENAFVGSNELDILSNGFKFTVTRAITNGSNNYIYAAFAESPFKYARAR